MRSPINQASLLSLMLFACACSHPTTQIAENTFVRGDKIYKVIDNELREIGDLGNDIKKLEVSKPKQRDLGTSSLSFVKAGAKTTLKALYRGNYLYYSLTVAGLNDLRESYAPGKLTIEFVDEYGFILHSTEVATNELTAMLNAQGKPDHFVYNGKTEMSTEINSAIQTYSVSASIRARSRYGYY